MDPVARVLLVVAQIPSGRVASYGDVGVVAGVGPRQVGAIMAQYGSSVPWWRVTNAAGVLPPQLLDEARQLWDAEGVRLRPDGRGCRISAHRADPQQLWADYLAAGGRPPQWD